MTEELVPVRLSHLLRDCSVGAIVRGPESLMVVQDIRSWNRPGEDPRDREIRYVDRVKSALGIQQVLCEPPRSTKRGGVETGWIPALRFPTWMRCTKCGLMVYAPWRNSKAKENDLPMSEHGGSDRAEACRDCNGTLEQTPWVLIHKDGYLADVPWHDLAHSKGGKRNRTECRFDRSNPTLKLLRTKVGWEVQCTRCNSRSVMPTRVPFSQFTWQQPWMRSPPEHPPDSDDLAQLVEINDVRVHSPSTCSALVIPPESRIRRGTVTDRLYGSTRSLQSIRNARNPLMRNAAVRRLAAEHRCTPDEINQAISDIDNGYPLYGRTVTEANLLADEYQALTAEISDLKEDEDFVTHHHTQGWKELGATLDAGTARQAVSAVSRLIAVNRLKEILIFNGFRRAGGEKLMPPDITGQCAWLPAIELYGEGIFFTLDEAILQRWEDGKAVRERANAFAKRYQKRAGVVQPGFEVEVSPRFLLCHTLAHLLIRELDSGAGYPAASLKERIYSDTGKMAGILIYVAVPDEEGSLGGLMELAKPHRFLRLLTKAFESGTWCSMDPVCSEQDGHGPDLLNRAACHACALVPETSCSYGNVLLDRAFVNGAAGDFPRLLDFVESID